MRPPVLLKLTRRRNDPDSHPDNRPGGRSANHPLLSGRRPPPAAAAEARPSLNDFVQQAAAAAADCGATVLELGLPTATHGHHFDPARYRWLGVPTSAGARHPSSGELPVDDEQFGIVLCAEVVATSPEPQGLLTELNRALEPDGRLFLAAPLIVPDSSEGYLPWRARLGLNYLLEASGFAIDELQALERTRSYGVIATKRRRPGHTRAGSARPAVGLRPGAGRG